MVLPFGEAFLITAFSCATFSYRVFFGKSGAIDRGYELCPVLWAPVSAEGASGATGYLLEVYKGLLGSRFCFLGKGKR